MIGIIIGVIVLIIAIKLIGFILKACGRLIGAALVIACVVFFGAIIVKICLPLAAIPITAASEMFAQIKEVISGIV